MADKWAVKSGNWSDPTLWNGGTKPTAGDDVYADGYAIAIDEDATVASINTSQRSGGTAGGRFDCVNGVTLTADVNAGTTYCLYGVHSGTFTVVGDVTGGSGSSASGSYNAFTGTIAITGNVTGGTGSSAYGVYNTSTGTIAITGNVTGGTGSSAAAIRNNSSGTITITGDVTGGSGSFCIGAYNIATGTITITGDVTGGSGSSAQGAYNNASGTIEIIGKVIGSEYGNGSVGYSATPGAYGSQNGLLKATEYDFGDRGMSPIHGVGFVRDLTNAVALVRLSDFTSASLVSALSTNNPPAESDVRDGVSYTTGGSMTGTLKVPAAQSVSYGVEVDATTGTAFLTQADLEAVFTLHGTGAYGGTLTVNDGSNPIENAKCRVTLAGVVKAGTSETDANGKITSWSLDAATYTLTITADGFEPVSTTLVVSGDAWTKTVSMTALNISVPSDPAQATGYLKCYDEEGNVKANVKATVVLKTAPTTDGYAYSNKPWTELSGSDGMLYFVGLWQTGVYDIKVGDGSWESFTVPSSTTFAIDEVIGK